MIRFFHERPQLVDLALAATFVLSFVGMMVELAAGNYILGFVFGGMMATSYIAQQILDVRAFKANPHDQSNGGLT